jgi:ADP-ribosylglycohydrolase
VLRVNLRKLSSKALTKAFFTNHFVAKILAGGTEMVKLNDKFFGCIAASNIASAMGAAVEGMDYWDIKEKYGVLEKLLPYNHYHHRDRLAGTTEDGIERQRLLTTAYIEKNGRISADDLKQVWIRDINPDNFNKQLEPCDEILYKLVKAGMPPRDIGHYSNYPGIVSFVRSCHPVGLMNAGNPEQAVRDALDLGSMYQPYHAYALEWGAAYCAAIAEALKPTATLDSIINTARNVLADVPRAEVDQGLEWAEQASNYEELRQLFYGRYNGRGVTYCMSMSHELVTKGLALLKFIGGDPTRTIVAAVNFGRDTDCTAAIAAGLAGAFKGSAGIPEEWIKQVDQATEANQFTVSQRTLQETADGLYRAYMAELNKTAGIVKMMKEA